MLARTESVETYDDGLWQAVAADLGCAGLLIPEADGGAGASYREMASAAEALGAAVAPVPYLGSAVVATAAALLGLAVRRAPRGSASPRLPARPSPRPGRADLLRKMADGRLTAALAVPFASAPGSAFPLSVRVVGPRPGDDRTGVARLRGMVSGVADALPAGVLLVPADGVPHGLYLVDMSAPGVAKAPVVSLDMTRQLCDLSFDDTPATLIVSGPAASRALAARAGRRGRGAGQRAGRAGPALRGHDRGLREGTPPVRPPGRVVPGPQAPAGRRVGRRSARLARRPGTRRPAWPTATPTPRSRWPWPRPTARRPRCTPRRSASSCTAASASPGNTPRTCT